MTGDHHHADMLRQQGATRLRLPALEDSPAPDDEFLRAVRDAAEGEFEVLGEMGRGQHGAIVYLARGAVNDEVADPADPRRPWRWWCPR